MDLSWCVVSFLAREWSSVFSVLVQTVVSRAHPLPSWNMLVWCVREDAAGMGSSPSLCKNTPTLLSEVLLQQTRLCLPQTSPHALCLTGTTVMVYCNNPQRSLGQRILDQQSWSQGVSPHRWLEMTSLLGQEASYTVTHLKRT